MKEKLFEQGERVERGVGLWSVLKECSFILGGQDGLNVGCWMLRWFW